VLVLGRHPAERWASSSPLCKCVESAVRKKEENRRKILTSSFNSRDGVLTSIGAEETVDIHTEFLHAIDPTREKDLGRLFSLSMVREKPKKLHSTSI
jgi:hypothetical protein